MLLSRVADSLYWAARYLERAHATARIVRTFTEVQLDLPVGLSTSWAPLLSIAGSWAHFTLRHELADEAAVVRFLVSDPTNLGSVVASVANARENLRTTREILPREAWQVANDLFLFTTREGERAHERRNRSWFLARVIGEQHHFDGIVESAMLRDEAYEIWRLGEAIERADMTTRLLGVRAVELLQQVPAGRAAGDTVGDTVDDHDEVQWMGILRSLSGMQMYSRVTAGPLDAAAVVDFLLREQRFPRSVAGCLERIHWSLASLPSNPGVAGALAVLEGHVATLPGELTDGPVLDAAMDRLQLALASLSEAVVTGFARAG